MLVLPCKQLLIGWRTGLAEIGTGPSRPNKKTVFFKIMKTYHSFHYNSLEV